MVLVYWAKTFNLLGSIVRFIMQSPLGIPYFFPSQNQKILKLTIQHDLIKCQLLLMNAQIKCLSNSLIYHWQQKHL